VSVFYLDASAVVKLFRSEDETSLLREALEGASTWVSTELVSVEARCTARRLGVPGLVERAEGVLENIELLAYTQAIQTRAGAGFRPALRALDAIHAATALALADDLESVFVYDLELSEALTSEGLRTESPGRTN